MASSSFQKLDLTIISAKDLKKVTLLSKMDVYAEATLSGDPRSKKRTRTDQNGHKNPSWDAQFQFSIPTNVDHSTLSIAIVVRAEKALGDRNIGEVRIPITELESEPNSFGSTQYVSYQVGKPGGKPKGILNISYRFGERPPPPETSAPPMEYPIAQSTSAAPPYLAQPYPPPHTAPTYPPQGYPPPKQGYDNHPPVAYPPRGNGGYNYQGYPPPPAAGYPYGAPPLMIQPSQKPQKKKFGLGLGAGLLGGAIGGMLIGDAVGDAVGGAADFDGEIDLW